jgi:hypothetical protein
MRERIGLDGTWRFWPDLNEKVDEPSYVSNEQLTSALGAPRAIAVPGPWQAQFDDLRLWAGTAWYERSFDIPSRWDGRLIRLCFGAVDYFCTAWINGEPVGEHEGGYLPFSFDVNDALVAGAPNLVTVKVLDIGPHGPASSPFPFDAIPHGKQSWYGPIGGLWQSVHLEASAHDFIERIAVQGDPATGIARIQTTLRQTNVAGRLSCSITSPDGYDTYHASAPVQPDGNSFDIQVSDARLWDVDSPHLYGVNMQLHDNGMVDATGDTFGFRSIAAEGGALLLNGRPLYLLGALDQDYYLGSIYTPPSDDLLRGQILKAKELGLNLLRCHIKVPDPRYLYWAGASELEHAHRGGQTPGQRNACGSHRARLQPSIDHHLDGDQRRLGRRHPQRPRAPAMDRRHLQVGEGIGPDTARGRQFGVPSELPCRIRPQRLPSLQGDARSPGGMGGVDVDVGGPPGEHLQSARRRGAARGRTHGAFRIRQLGSARQHKPCRRAR